MADNQCVSSPCDCECKVATLCKLAKLQVLPVHVLHIFLSIRKKSRIECYWLQFAAISCCRTTPIPVPDASVVMMKPYFRSGIMSTGPSIRRCFNVSKAFCSMMVHCHDVLFYSRHCMWLCYSCKICNMVYVEGSKAKK
jgi:hypothetical protein